MEPIEAVQAQHLGEIMMNFKNSKIILSVFGLAFWFCSPALAQRQADTQRKMSEQGRNEYGVEQTPDLSQENLGRVAASATQIRTVLVKDEGLLVELKR